MAALNQLYYSKEKREDFLQNLDHVNKNTHTSVKDENKISGGGGGVIGDPVANRDMDDSSKLNNVDTITTSNHYCIIESDHPYKSASINVYRLVNLFI